MNMKKLVWLLCLVLALAMGTAALADDVPAGLIGEWQLLTMEGEEVWDSGEGIGIIFTDTVMKLLEDGSAQEVSYSIQGQYIVVNGSTFARYELLGDVFKLYNGDTALVFGRVYHADASALIGEWKMVGVEGDIPWMEEGMSYTFSFTETEMTMTLSAYGKVESQTTPYTVEGNQIIAEGVGERFSVEGDTFRLYSGDAAMVFVRVGSQADAAATPAEEEPTLIGEWEMIDPTGIRWVYIFTQTEMTMLMTRDGETTSRTIPYTIKGNKLDYGTFSETFTLQGDTLSFYNGSMVFHRVVSKPAEKAADNAALIGAWTLMTDGEGNTAAMAAAGYQVKMVFTETERTMTISMMGNSMTDTTTYTVQGNEIVTAAGRMTWSIENDVLTVTEPGMSLQLVRVNEDSPIGQWKLVDVTGQGEMGKLWPLAKLAGPGMVSFTLDVSEDKVIMAFDIFGESDSDEMRCTISGATMTMEDGTVGTIREGKLYLPMDNDMLVFERQ